MFDIFEVEILLLCKNMQLGLMKVIKFFWEFLNFLWKTSSQHDGYHVGFTLQSVLHCVELGGICEWNLTNI